MRNETQNKIYNELVEKIIQQPNQDIAINPHGLANMLIDSDWFKRMPDDNSTLSDYLDLVVLEDNIKKILIELKTIDALLKQNLLSSNTLKFAFECLYT